MSTTKSTDDKNNLETKSITELLEIAENTKRILEQKQGEIRDAAVQNIIALAKESGLRVLIREPKKRGEKSAEKLYRNPDDHSQTWNGKGASPKWIKSSGKDKSEFEVKTETEAATTNA
jgi:DNA-binding protein H-NS